MSFKNIQNLATDFASSWYLASTSKSFHLITESEINGLKNISYPLCVVEPPSSKISDINRAREEYDLTCFILIKKSLREVDYNPASLYDESLSLFNNFIGFLAAQRNGQYVIDGESFDIERVSRFGSDMSIGIKVNFTLLAPSKLAFAGTTPALSTLPYTNNLWSFHTSVFGVTTAENYMSWLPLINNTGGTFALASEETDQVPTLTTRNTIAFSSPTDTSSSESLSNSSLTLNATDFTVFVTLQTPEEPSPSGYSTIFNIKGNNDLDNLILKIQNFGQYEGTMYLDIVQDSGVGTTPRTSAGSYIIITSNVKPYGTLGNPKTIALAHEGSDGKIRIYWQNELDVIQSREIEQQYIGGGSKTFRLGARQDGTDNNSGLIAEVSNVAIYREVLSEQDVFNVMLSLNNL
jgi:hypothetical protein